MDWPHALFPGPSDAPALRLHAECHDLTSDTTRHGHLLSPPGGSLRGRDQASPSCPRAEVTSKGRDRTIVFIRRLLAVLRLLFPVLPGVGKSWVERAKKDKGVGCELRRDNTRGGVSRPPGREWGRGPQGPWWCSEVVYLLFVESPLRSPWEQCGRRSGWG